MFTGIVEEIGKIEKVASEAHQRHFRIVGSRVLEDIAPEDSVSVNGVCLTVTKVGEGYFETDAVEETLQKSTLGNLQAGVRVNLERALRLGDRLGGHIVLGHVDGVGKVVSVVAKGRNRLLEIEVPESLFRYTIEKGSVAVDGVSLTIAKMEKNRITVSLIPFTLEHTTLGSLRPGSRVNIEVDFFGKYVEQFLQKSGEGGLKGEEWFRSMGY